MAIKDGFYGYVGGTVSRVFEAKSGPAAVIEVQDEKAMYPDRVTVWGLPTNIASGDRIKVKGWVKVRPSTYQKKDGTEGHGVEVNINGAEVVEHERGSVDNVASTLGGTEVNPDAPF